VETLVSEKNPEFSRGFHFQIAQPLLITNPSGMLAILLFFIGTSSSN
jgi:hypothetical protein